MPHWWYLDGNLVQWTPRIPSTIGAENWLAKPLRLARRFLHYLSRRWSCMPGQLGSDFLSSWRMAWHFLEVSGCLGVASVGPRFMILRAGCVPQLPTPTEGKLHWCEHSWTLSGRYNNLGKINSAPGIPQIILCEKLQTQRLHAQFKQCILQTFYKEKWIRDRSSENWKWSGSFITYLQRKMASDPWYNKQTRDLRRLRRRSVATRPVYIQIVHWHQVVPLEEYRFTVKSTRFATQLDIP